MPKKKDFILIGVLLVIALVGLAVTRLLQHQSGASVTITVGGEVYGTYPLNQSREIEISDDKGYNKVVIENGAFIWKTLTARISTAFSMQRSIPAMRPLSAYPMNW